MTAFLLCIVFNSLLCLFYSRVFVVRIPVLGQFLLGLSVSRSLGQGRGKIYFD